MTFIVPFEAEFVGEVRTIYSVNEDNPKSRFSSTTTSQKCPHCGERHFYRVYHAKRYYEEDGWGIDVFDCKCASCRKEFDLEVEYEID